MEQLFFDIVVFFRTDRNHPDTTGHPVDRVELNSFIKTYYDKREYDGSPESFMRFKKHIDFEVNRFLNSIFDAKIIFGTSNPTNSGMASERHAIRVEDIRNIVVTDFEEQILDNFEYIFKTTL